MIVSFWCRVCRKYAYVTVGVTPIRCIACGSRSLAIRVLSNGNNYNGSGTRHVLGCKIAYRLESAR